MQYFDANGQLMLNNTNKNDGACVPQLFYDKFSCKYSKKYGNDKQQRFPNWNVADIAKNMVKLWQQFVTNPDMNEVKKYCQERYFARLQEHCDSFFNTHKYQEWNPMTDGVNALQFYVFCKDRKIN